MQRVSSFLIGCLLYGMGQMHVCLTIRMIFHCPFLFTDFKNFSSKIENAQVDILDPLEDKIDEVINYFV